MEITVQTTELLADMLRLEAESRGIDVDELVISILSDFLLGDPITPQELERRIDRMNAGEGVPLAEVRRMFEKKYGCLVTK